MPKKKYLILNKTNDEVEYYIFKSIKGDEIKYKLTYSKSEAWNNPEATILTIIDNGDNFNINFESGNNDISSLEYDDAISLALIMEFIKKKDRVLMPKYRTIKSK